jgi:hypothetical protein
MIPRMVIAERVWRSLAPTPTQRTVIFGLLMAYLVALTLLVIVGGHLWLLVVAPFWIFGVAELRRSFIRQRPGNL